MFYSTSVTLLTVSMSKVGTISNCKYKGVYLYFITPMLYIFLIPHNSMLLHTVNKIKWDRTIRVR